MRRATRSRTAWLSSADKEAHSDARTYNRCNRDADLHHDQSGEAHFLILIDRDNFHLTLVLRNAFVETRFASESQRCLLTRP